MWGSVMRDARMHEAVSLVHIGRNRNLCLVAGDCTQNMRLHLAGFIVVCEMYEAFT
jgi:hypothetical protein